MVKENGGFSVLNLIINGLPSKLKEYNKLLKTAPLEVLNLIINGLPSKLGYFVPRVGDLEFGFKPYYKWITF